MVDRPYSGGLALELHKNELTRVHQAAALRLNMLACCRAVSVFSLAPTAPPGWWQLRCSPQTCAQPSRASVLPWARYVVSGQSRLAKPIVSDDTQVLKQMRALLKVVCIALLV
jgi:hypothetical protein